MGPNAAASIAISFLWNQCPLQAALSLSLCHFDFDLWMLLQCLSKEVKGFSELKAELETKLYHIRRKLINYDIDIPDITDSATRNQQFRRISIFGFGPRMKWAGEYFKLWSNKHFCLFKQPLLSLSTQFYPFAATCPPPPPPPAPRALLLILPPPPLPSQLVFVYPSLFDLLKVERLFLNFIL